MSNNSIVQSQWIECADRMPPLLQNCVLASVNRMRAHDSEGCYKCVGHLADSGNGLYWSTQNNEPALTSNAFTHWMPIDDPMSIDT